MTHEKQGGPEWCLSTGRVAQIFGVSPQTIGDWADDGHLAHVRTEGGHRRFRAADVAALQIILCDGGPSTGAPEDGRKALAV